MAALSTTAIIGITSAAIAAGGAAKSFSDSGKQGKLQREAERNAKDAMAKVIEQVKLNPYDKLGIFKEPYELQREALNAQGGQLVEAGQESERGAAATAGRVYLGQTEAQQGVRTEMGTELKNLEKLSADENVNIKNELASIGLSQAQGYQTQAKEAKEAKAAAIAQGMSQAGTALQTGIQTFVPLYQKQHGIDPLTGNKIVQPPAAPNPLLNRQDARADAPTSKLSSFQKMPTWQELYEESQKQNPFNI